MEDFYDNDMLLYPIGLDISKLDDILNNNLPLDNLKLYKYIDVINDNIELEELSFINDSICIVFIPSKEEITQNDIKGILVPTSFSDSQLYTLRYLCFDHLDFEQIKDKCEKFLMFLEKFGYQRDEEKYEDSFRILEYSFKYCDLDSLVDIEESRNYLNEDLGYDVMDTFTKLLNNFNITLFDLVCFLNKDISNIFVNNIDFVNLRHNRIR